MPEKITAADRKKLAAFRAGLILESVVNGGWWPEELEQRYGRDTLQLLTEDIGDIAARLIRQGGRDTR